MSLSDDELGGDSACWAHIFEDTITPAANGGEDQPAAGVVDLAAMARAATAPGVAWSRQSDDLNVNLLTFASGDGVEAHVNNEVDVLVVAIAGEGILTVDGVHRPLRAGQAVLIPKGARRSITSASDQFAYLTCHKRRAGLWPTPRG